MSLMDEKNGVSEVGNSTGELDDALRDFRLSVHAWSEAAYGRTRTVAAAAPQRQLWRQTTGWALGCVLIAGGASAGVWGHHRQEMKAAAANAAQHERLAAEQRMQLAREEDEDLLARVDSDVSREVPSALEPLAQLMAADESRYGRNQKKISSSTF
jgi:hypothetical protein